MGSFCSDIHTDRNSNRNADSNADRDPYDYHNADRDPDRNIDDDANDCAEMVPPQRLGMADYEAGCMQKRAKRV